MPIRRLTTRTYRRALRELTERDPDLSGILSRLGPPPMWERPPGFSTLVLMILEQQVSLASAKAAYDRLVAAVRTVTPRTFLKLDDVELRRIGFSRQKTGYVRNLASALLDGSLDLDALASRPDDEVREELVRIKGIGRWTADVYLLMVLMRPDIWPSGDLALAGAAESVKGLSSRPTPSELDELSVDWRPWRAVAARLLWHHYLAERANRASKS